MLALESRSVMGLLKVILMALELNGIGGQLLSDPLGGCPGFMSEYVQSVLLWHFPISVRVCFFGEDMDLGLALNGGRLDLCDAVGGCSSFIPGLDVVHAKRTIRDRLAYIPDL